MSRPIGVLDLETDPFTFGKPVKPFVAEFWDGRNAAVFWGKDCIKKLCAYLKTRPPFIIYAHNGGKFDYMFLLDDLYKEMRIVNGRIIQAFLGEHELRDSYAILPFPLRDFDKDEIDYEKMRPECREKHKDEICAYLHKDCTSLLTLVLAFWEEFGDNLTVGGSALKQLKRFHKFKSGGDFFDAKFRTPFYFGGRVQCFKTGIIKQRVAIYDINSQYPYSMKTFLHPVSIGHEVSRYIEDNTCFVVAEGKNYGAFPSRLPTGGLDFTRESGVFSTTIHEWNAALETGAFEPRRILKTYGFTERQSFDSFVDHFYSERRLAKSRGDKIHALFYKYVLNSSYGKFAQNPENYQDWFLMNCERDEWPDLTEWTPAYWHGHYIIFERPTLRKHYYNVATGASITGAARSILMRGLASSVRPIYCDTDSIMCASLNPGVPIHDDDLGAFKCEAVGDLAAICGKKLYAIWKRGHATDNQEEAWIDGELYHLVKKAHKGVRLTGAQILNIAAGGVEEYANPVPKFHFGGDQKFTKRKIRMTV